ncbi:MAG: DUF1015 domain-containing protein [Chloroflexota bacterium]|nr:DUF1015 domain-containing protein [Chloroflexota bacterium]
MAEIVPFHGLRYDEAKAGPLGDVISPPYDVITDELRDRLYERGPYNVVRVEYGREEPGDGPTADRYTRAKETLETWISEEVLRHDNTPAFYLYDHYFEHAGRRLRRRGFLGALRLYQEGRGVVRPHELTFPKATADRLRLLRATRVNTSPVFGLFADERGEVARSLEAWMSRGPAPLVGEARVGAERHLVWRLDDRTLMRKLAGLLKDARIYIADGHHRYETALTYLDDERKAGHIEMEQDSPNYVLAYLCPLDDPGLLILATHRIVRGGDAVLDELVARSFDDTPIDAGALGDTQPGIVLVRDGLFTELRPRADADLSALHETWRTLPVAQAEHLLLEPARAGGATVEYDHDAQRAAAAATRGTSAVLLRAVDAATLRRVADAWQRLPQKTTYFHPKVPAGLVLRPLGD